MLLRSAPLVSLIERELAGNLRISLRYLRGPIHSATGPPAPYYPPVIGEPWQREKKVQGAQVGWRLRPERAALSKSIYEYAP